jgi:hypothetical protein
VPDRCGPWRVLWATAARAELLDVTLPIRADASSAALQTGTWRVVFLLGDALGHIAAVVDGRQDLPDGLQKRVVLPGAPGR